MSKEAAAATLTQVYFAHIGDAERKAMLGAKEGGEPFSARSVEVISHVYGAFLAGLDLFQQDEEDKYRKKHMRPLE